MALWPTRYEVTDDDCSPPVVKDLFLKWRESAAADAYGRADEAAVGIGYMNREKALKLLNGGEEGVEEWNWLCESGEAIPDLRGSYLSGSDIRHVDLSDVNLRGSDLSRADLTGANLSGSNLSGADLIQTNLSDANLSDANLCETTLYGTVFFRSHMAKTHCSNAKMHSTIFSDVDLSQVKGLIDVDQYGPSSIGLDTILRSHGSIPEEFLRACKCDPLIQKILMGEKNAQSEAFYEWFDKDGGPIRLQTCFISYATADKAFADRLQKALNAVGVDYWYAPEHGEWGKEIKTQIDREISLRDRVVLVCSKTSLNDSDWVKWEIAQSIKQEQDRGQRVLFPIMIDDELLNWNDPKGERMREVLAADFRGATKGKKFDAAVKRLLAGLKQEDAAKPST